MSAPRACDHTWLVPFTIETELGGCEDDALCSCELPAAAGGGDGGATHGVYSHLRVIFTLSIVI